MTRWLPFLLVLLWLPAGAAPRPHVVAREVVGTASQPTAVALAADGAVYALDTEGRLLAWGASGAATAVAAGDLRRPLGLAAVPQGWLVADTGGRRLVWLDPAGHRRRQWPLPELPCPGSDGDEADDCRVPAEPVAVALAGKRLFWSDRAAQRLCSLDWDSGAFRGCVGKRGRMTGQFQYPYQIAVDPDRYLYVVDILNARIQVFDDSGRYFFQIGRFGLGPTELYRPDGIALDGKRGLLFVSDGYFGTIRIFYHGVPWGELADAQGKPLVFDAPTGLAYRDGTLIVAETGASRVIRLRLGFAEALAPKRRQKAEASRKDCLMCHLSFVTEAPFKVRAPDRRGQLPVASFRMCYSCHSGPVIDSRTIIHSGAQHPTLYDPEDKRKRHPWPRKDKLPDDFPLTGDHQLTCTSCHTPHTDAENPRTLYPGHHNAWLRVANDDGRLCERCHESKAKAARQRSPRKRGLNHPLGIRLRPPPFKGVPDFPSDPDLTHGLPATLARAGGALGPQGGVVCQTCHQIHGGVSEDLLLMDDDCAQLCRQCHRRQFSRSKAEARRKGVHPVNVEPEEAMRRNGKKVRFVTCTSCHPVHDGKPGTPMLVKPVPELCHDCHRRQHARGKEEALKKGVHPVNFDLEEPVTLKGKKIKRVDCLTCHAVHRGKPGTPALVANHRNGALCRPCHRDNLPVVGSDHDLRVTAAKSHNRFDETPRQSGVCGACHTLHRGKGKWPFLYAARIVGHPGKSTAKGDETKRKRDQLCLNCHQDHPRAVARKKVVAWFRHPFKDIVLHSDKDHMPLLDTRERDADFGAIGCTTCHDPHVWTPAHRNAASPPLTGNRRNLEGDPHSSFLREIKPEKTFCLGCHALETRTKYKYFHDRLVRGVVDYLR